jgi:tetratricopeptide (TPR) repeat protein
MCKAIAEKIIDDFVLCDDKALKKGEELLAAGKYAEAELEFKIAQQTPQPQPRALVGLGEVYLNQGRLDRASAFLAKAKELLPDDVDVRLKLGMCQLSLRQPAEARSAARFVLERRPADPEAPLLLADTSQNGPEVEESRAILKALPAPANEGAPALAGQAMLAALDGDVPPEQALAPLVEAVCAAAVQMSERLRHQPEQAAWPAKTLNRKAA